MMSFYNYGIKTTWSDGATPLGGMLDGNTARACPTCRAVLWKKDFEVLGRLTKAPRPIRPFCRKLAAWFGDKYGHRRAEDEWAAIPAAWKEAEHGDRLEYTDVQRALLAMREPDRDREMFMRRRVWWKTNDHIRRHPDGSPVTVEPVAPEPERQANMLRMIELHELAGSSLSERAELLRNLGRFADAIRLWRSGAPEIRSSSTAAWTLCWAKAGDSDVRTFNNVPTVWSDVSDSPSNPGDQPSEAARPVPRAVW